MVKTHWKNRNVFVTGATGLLGSWLTRRLKDDGANIVALVRDWTPKSNLVLDETIQQVTVVRGEVEDRALLERALNEYEIEVVFHLAAQTIVGAANRSPIGTFETNIKGTWNILEACRQTRSVKRIVVASSDKAYGDQKKLPYTEETALNGKHPYDVSKSCADLLCHAYYKSYGLPVAITRCGNFFGGGDLNLNRVVPGTIVSLLRGERPVIRSNGKFIRDYIYVEDGVDAYLHLAEALADRKYHGEAFNFSYEKPLTVLQIVGLVSRLMESPLKPRILNQATNEIIDQHLSSRKAKAVLGWKPLFNLEKGLLNTIEWYRTHFSN
ncbi:MAG: CDP-glucose 4,6-dehydratase [Elusimicrobia bacterium]|nr:CDP-glucose 4,6-dehydratase [Elusimicrobiota bacterium]